MIDIGGRTHGKSTGAGGSASGTRTTQTHSTQRSSQRSNGHHIVATVMDPVSARTNTVVGVGVVRMVVITVILGFNYSRLHHGRWHSSILNE